MRSMGLGFSSGKRARLRICSSARFWRVRSRRKKVNTGRPCTRLMVMAISAGKISPLARMAGTSVRWPSIEPCPADRLRSTRPLVHRVFRRKQDILGLAADHLGPRVAEGPFGRAVEVANHAQVIDRDDRVER